jgi:small subunit ribosomal protein S21
MAEDLQPGGPRKENQKSSDKKVHNDDLIKEIKRHSFYLKPGEKLRVKQALARKRKRRLADKSPVLDRAALAAPDLDLHFDPAFEPAEVKDVLAALADYYRACGGAGFKIEIESQEASVKDPAHV